MLNPSSCRRGVYIVLFITTLCTFFLVNNVTVYSGPWQETSSSGRKESPSWKDQIISVAYHHWRRLFSITPKIWPNQDEGDRIIEQFNYAPDNLNEITDNGSKLKTILLYTSTSLWISGTRQTYTERRTFLEENCLVNTCRITTNRSEFENADAVIFTDDYKLPNETRPNYEQVWVLYVLESPLHTRHFSNKTFNWTVSYRPDSDVPNPYGRYFLNDPAVKFKIQTVNYAFNKTKKVAWFVNNCAANNKRLQYALELGKHIQVDIYGRCIPNNSLQCPRSKEKECYEMLKRDYKFYLSFENSNCHHYITEKFFDNALGNNVVPIVMGARPMDYKRAAPYHSFIHVDDFYSPRDLAVYLHELDNNDALYNEYFQWKGTGELSPNLNAHFWCRFCAVLHSDIPKKTYDDINGWWRPNGTCTPETWKTSGKLL